MSASFSEKPVLSFSELGEWEAWLVHNGAASKGIWLKFAKKSSGAQTLSKQDALDGALCFGWIDGRLEKCDKNYWQVHFSPRTKTSKWSQKNRLRAEYLIAASRMREAGLMQVERAKQDGRWEAAYPSQSRAEVPTDLQAALEGNDKAKAFFLKLTANNRYAILYRLHQSNAAPARASKIAKFVSMLERGETFHPQK